jgi:excisionase family DNA binding protein/PAS domain S-box-containing protein
MQLAVLPFASHPNAPAERGSPSDFCTVREAALDLGVSRVTIWRWIKAGHPPATRPGLRVIRIRRADLQALQTPLQPSTDMVPGVAVLGSAGSRPLDATTVTPALSAAALHPAQHLMALAEHSPDVIFRLDRNLRHLYLSPAVERAWGQPPSALLGKTVRELGLPPAAADRFAKVGREVLATGQAAAVEFAIADRSYRARLIPEVAADTTDASVLGITEDITERRSIERVQQEFIATASHDLKTPLTAIIGYAQFVIRGLRAPVPDLRKVEQGAAMIVAQAWAMTELINDLLDASRVELDALQLRTAPHDLGIGLATLLARLTPDERARIELVLPDGPLAGDWDGARVEQVLANLVGNALKYSPADTPVQLHIERREREIAVAISDQGLGIPADELPRLFQRFYRTPAARTSGLSGTGLGLYISAGIVAAHGGRLWAESAGEGRGSTFRFTLPVAAPPGSHARWS